MDTKQRMRLTCALCAIVSGAGAAYAQGAQPTQGTAPSAASNGSDAGSTPAEGTTNSQGIGIQEIVVTANKRAENLQKVAATVAAVTNAQLIRQGVKDPQDINRVVPEVTITNSVTANVTIRGVRTGAFGPTTDSPNAVHIDGVYVSRFSALQGLFFDTQRVEVLEGPQGTLYGRNSAGGTINIISNKPSTDALHAIGSLEYGNYNTFTANAAVNVPLSDTLAIRGAYYHNSHRGYRDDGRDDQQLDAGRLSLLWKPSSSDSLLLTADRNVQGGKGPAGAQITEVLKQPTIYRTAAGGYTLSIPGTLDPNTGRPVDSVAGSGAVVPILTGGSNDFQKTLGLSDANRIIGYNTGYMAQYDHDFGWANLTFQASRRSNYLLTRGGTTQGYIQDPRLITASVVRPGAPTFGEAHARWDTQELRLTSPSNRELTYVVGLYRFHENSFDSHSGNYFITYPNTSAATLGTFIIANPLVVNQDISNDYNITNAYAAFGQATYSPSALEGLHITGGVRYNYEKKRGAGFEILNRAIAQIPAAPAPPQQSSVFVLSRRDKAVTYKANLSYDITNRNLIYFDHSTGFKSGGFAYGFNPAYNPEKIWSYEIGSKNRFLNDTLQINLSAWHYDYHNIVTTINQFFFDVTANRPSAVINTANGRRAKIDGQTAAIDFQFTHNDIFSINATHLNARFTDYDLGPNYAIQLQNNLAPGADPTYFNYSNTPIGNDLKWAGNASYDHIFQMAGGELDAQVSAHYTGKRLFGNQAARANVNNYIIGSPYATVDAQLRYQPKDGAWSLTAYVRNIANKAVHTGEGYTSNANFYATNDARVTFAYRTVNYGPPRTFGAILSYRY